MSEERIKISVNEEDVQNIIDCYEKDIEHIKQLQQENQQLRQKCDKTTTKLRQKCEVLDEIRECTRKYCSGIFTDEGEIVFVTPTANIVQILDKVKENERGETNNKQS